MESISDRFLFFLREMQLNQKEFCQKTGYGTQSLSKFVSGSTSNPGVHLFILTAQHYPQVNINWLLTGEEPMWNEGQAEEVPKKHTRPMPANGLKIMGTGLNASILQDLLDTKDQLIQSQSKRIEQLEGELIRLKK